VLCSGANPLLLYFKERPEQTPCTADGGLALSGAALIDGHVPGRAHSFIVLTKDRQYFFEAFTADDYVNWRNAIRNAIKISTPTTTIDFGDLARRSSF
jgi:hypothetical protein